MCETFIIDEEQDAGPLRVRLCFTKDREYLLTERQVIELATTGAVWLTTAQGGGRRKEVRI